MYKWVAVHVYCPFITLFCHQVTIDLFFMCTVNVFHIPDTRLYIYNNLLYMHTVKLYHISATKWLCI